MKAFYSFLLQFCGGISPGFLQDPGFHGLAGPPPPLQGGAPRGGGGEGGQQVAAKNRQKSTNTFFSQKHHKCHLANAIVGLFDHFGQNYLLLCDEKFLGSPVLPNNISAPLGVHSPTGSCLAGKTKKLNILVLATDAVTQTNAYAQINTHKYK